MPPVTVSTVVIAKLKCPCLSTSSFRFIPPSAQHVESFSPIPSVYYDVSGRSNFCHPLQMRNPPYFCRHRKSDLVLPVMAFHRGHLASEKDLPTSCMWVKVPLNNCTARPLAAGRFVCLTWRCPPAKSPVIPHLPPSFSNRLHKLVTLVHSLAFSLSFCRSWTEAKKAPTWTACRQDLVPVLRALAIARHTNGVSILTWSVPNALHINVQCAPRMKSKIYYGRTTGTRTAV